MQLKTCKLTQAGVLHAARNVLKRGGRTGGGQRGGSGGHAVSRPRLTYPASLLSWLRFLFPKTKNQKDQRQVGLSRKHLTLKLFLGFVPEFLSSHNRTLNCQHSVCSLPYPPWPLPPGCCANPRDHSPSRPPPSSQGLAHQQRPPSPSMGSAALHPFLAWLQGAPCVFP